MVEPNNITRQKNERGEPRQSIIDGIVSVRLFLGRNGGVGRGTQCQ